MIMSKEHKMTYMGKKYVTKIQYGCRECAFFRFTECPNICKSKCAAVNNKDRTSRIWVEDKSVPKKNTGNYVWVIEKYNKILKKWIVFDTKISRGRARRFIINMKEGLLGYANTKFRIIKYIPME